ncbi:MAG TPA: HigA family addiction module antitoxin [Allosphingosinicella sp.]|nr:HigA family addiction module antitoxin [Allosphingosinicella sp.]
MSRSPTITDPNWLENEHAGRLLASELMEPLGLSTDQLAAALQVSAEQVSAVLGGETAIDAELDLRLCRYFGLSEGFFMRLQIRYELLEAKRALNGELDRIVPRAA